MVGRWGMSEAVGLVAVLGTDSAGSWAPWSGDGPSEKTRQLVDDEVRALTDTAYDEALELLHDHLDRLAALAQALLDRETLDEADAYAAAGIPRPHDGSAATPTHAHAGQGRGLPVFPDANGRSPNLHNPSTPPSPGTRTLEVDEASERSPS